MISHVTELTQRQKIITGLYDLMFERNEAITVHKNVGNGIKLTTKRHTQRSLTLHAQTEFLAPPGYNFLKTKQNYGSHICP